MRVGTVLGFTVKIEVHWAGTDLVWISIWWYSGLKLIESGIDSNLVSMTSSMTYEYGHPRNEMRYVITCIICNMIYTGKTGR